LKSPLSNITDGYEFQLIMAEYFRSLNSDKKDYRVEVFDNGVGPDGGFDILVEFHHENVIGKHCIRWIVECKCWNEKSSVGLDDIHSDGIISLVNAKKAQGYLLICKGTVTDTLKKRFKDLTESNIINPLLFEVWEGTRVWSQISQKENLMKAFFSEFYQEEFIDNKAKEKFDKYVKEYEERIKNNIK
jgi:hypothetical protein